MNTTNENNASRYDEQVPVLIVGGSLVGLSTAMFLSWHKIPYVLVERHEGISPFTRAGGFNPRTLELFRMVGVENAVRQAEPPDMQNLSILRVESLAGNELTSYVQNLSDFNTQASPIKGSFITQDLLEPVLRAHAEKLGGDLRFNTKLIAWEQDTDGVSAVIRNQASGQERRIRARYLVAADGNDSPIRERLGIAVNGPGALSEQIFLYFKADLREALRGRRMLFCVVANPEVQGVLGATPDGESGILGIPYYPDKGERVEDYAGERGIKLIRAAVGIADLPVEITEMRTWTMAAFLAERFQQGRVFLAGDSAHVVPPTGGFGANTGIADAHNLAWKLALVLKGQAGPDLLATYDAERRLVGQLTVEQAFALYAERMAPHLINQAKPKLDYNTIIMGYRYQSAAVLSDPEDGEDLYEDPTHPSGRSGTRAPYVALERHGAQISTLDLFGRNFVLLAGPDGIAWCDAARLVTARLSLDLDAYPIGGEHTFTDSAGNFLTSYGITSAGAVLVRPDGFIGWRASGMVEQPERELTRALERLLCRA